LVHVIVAFPEFVTVQDITPAGTCPPPGPVTVAVKVVVPPKEGEADEVIVTVGVTCEIPRVNELDAPAM
jgi:hypothetical protein